MGADRKDADIKPARPDVKGSRNNSASADLDRGIVGEDGDDDSDGEAGLNAPVAQSLENKKKKRKKSKTKRSKGKVDLEQTTPPTIPVADLFPSGYPTGQLVPHENLSRTTDEEKRYNSRLWDDGFLSDYRQAAEIHRQVRQYAQKEVIKPGATLQTIAEAIENGVYALTGHQGLEAGDGLKAGMGFPAGLCLNNVAAHWTPNPGGKDVVLQPSDVLKVDFGVHVNGRIVDSAFTASFDPTYDNLLEAVKAATNIGIAHAGVDARISDISAAIQEVMESYEVEIGRKTFPVKAVRNITGHDILQYRIHGNKQIPFIKNDSQQKMEEGEVFAIETFGSTDKAFLDDDVSKRLSALTHANLSKDRHLWLWTQSGCLWP